MPRLEAAHITATFGFPANMTARTPRDVEAKDENNFAFESLAKRTFSVGQLGAGLTFIIIFSGIAFLLGVGLMVCYAKKLTRRRVTKDEYLGDVTDRQTSITMDPDFVAQLRNMSSESHALPPYPSKSQREGPTSQLTPLPSTHLGGSNNNNADIISRNEPLPVYRP